MIVFIKQIFNKLFSYFAAGLLVILPFASTTYVVSLVLTKLDRIIILNTGVKIPGLGMALSFICIAFVGHMGSNFLIKSCLNFLENITLKLPFINLVYSSFKELTAALVGSKKKFDKPVLITINQMPLIQQLGFVTQEGLNNINLLGKIAVYVPQSYSFSGDLYILSKDQVEPIDLASTEVIQFIVSGGVTELKQSLQKVHTRPNRIIDNINA